MNKMPENLLYAIRDAERILLCAHVSPDGDTIGSTLALMRALALMGKQVEAICADEAPALLSFLPGVENLKKPEALSGKEFDLAIAVDVSDDHRLGDCAPLYFAARQTAQLDHHGTNPGFAKINVVHEDTSATGVLIYELIKVLEIPMDIEIATCLYAGIATDTGNFSFSNTDSDTFFVMGELMRLGLPIAKLSRVLFRERSREQVLVLAKALSTLSFHAQGQIAAMQLTQEDLAACGAKPEHAEAIVNYGIDVTGVRVAFLAREVDEGVKFSLRAVEGCNVAKIASRYSGGGHPLAAGCTMHVPLTKAVEVMVAAMAECLLEDIT